MQDNEPRPDVPQITSISTSESIDALAKAMCTFHAALSSVTIKKDGTNPHFQYKYATLDNIWSSIRKTLADAKLSVMQFPTHDGLVSLLMHESGQFIQTTMPCDLSHMKAQEQGSMLTYLRRYSMSAILGLATENDDDGNAATATKKADINAVKSRMKNVAPKQKTGAIVPARGEQIAAIKGMVDDIDALETWLGERYGCGLSGLTVEQADAVIEVCNKKRATSGAVSA